MILFKKAREKTDNKILFPINFCLLLFYFTSCCIYIYISYLFDIVKGFLLLMIFSYFFYLVSCYLLPQTHLNLFKSKFIIFYPKSPSLEPSLMFLIPVSRKEVLFPPTEDNCKIYAVKTRLYFETQQSLLGPEPEIRPPC